MVDTEQKVEILMDAVNDLQTEAAKRVYDDDEIEAMRAAYEALKGLSPEAHDRALNWLRAKLESERV